MENDAYYLFGGIKTGQNINDLAKDFGKFNALAMELP